MQLAEGTGQQGVGNLVVGDPQCLEEGLVHEAACHRSGTQVEVLKVGTSQRQGLGDPGLESLVLKAEVGDDGFGIAAFAADAGLLFGKELFRNLILVVGGEQLALLLGDLPQHAVAAGKLLAAGSGLVGEVLLERVLDTGSLVVAEPDGGVVALDRRLNIIDALCGLWALMALVGRADEVLVCAAVALVARVGQSATAVAAVQAAFEVVGMLAVALAALLVRAQDSLDTLEQFLGDERLMPTLVGLVAVANYDGRCLGVRLSQSTCVVTLEAVGYLLRRRFPSSGS